MKISLVLILVVALSSMIFTGCTSISFPKWDQFSQNTTDGETNIQGSTGTIQVHVTDAPGEVTEVNLTVTEVEVHKAGGEGEMGEWISLPVQEDTFNLIGLQGITLNLASATVEAGKYTQLRMVIDDNNLIVKTEDGPEEGYTATVPSGELKFVRTFTLEAGGVINLTVDIDAAKSVIFPGGKNGGPDKVIFKPVVKLMVENEPQQQQATEEMMAVFNPVIGPIGTSIGVTGSGWDDSELINQVTVGGLAATHSLVVDDDGNITGNILVPVLNPGIQDIHITGSSSGEQIFTDAFTVIPTAAFDPINGPVETEIVVTGTGWVSLDTIDAVTVGGETATYSLIINGSGNLSGTIIVPLLEPGSQNIVITGTASGEQTFTDAFTVIPTASFVPASGPVTTEINVTGTGWASLDTIDEVTIGGVLATYSLIIDGSGNLSGTIIVPALGVDTTYNIVITGSSSGIQTFIDAFTVTT